MKTRSESKHGSRNEYGNSWAISDSLHASTPTVELSDAAALRNPATPQVDQAKRLKELEQENPKHSRAALDDSAAYRATVKTASLEASLLLPVSMVAMAIAGSRCYSMPADASARIVSRVSGVARG